jgi:hypothetical protein
VKRSDGDESIQVVIHLSMEAMLGISLYREILISTRKKRYVFLIIAYVFSSTKLEKREKQVLPGSEEGGRVTRRMGRGLGGGGRDGPNIACTYE